MYLKKIKTPFDALQRAVEICGTQAELASRIGVTQSHVSHLIFRYQGQVGPRFAIAVEKAVNGKVTRHELRPDFYPVEK